MKCITVQHKSVLEQLNKNGIYRADIDKVSENLVKPYQFMQNYFGWNNIPIFLAPIGFNTNMGGAKFLKDYVAIELNIPDELCKVQRYYDWTDFIYFTECPGEFEDAINIEQYPTVTDWAKTIMDIGIDYTNMDPMQVTVEYLHKDWILNYTDKLDKLGEEQNDNGGDYKLQPLFKYM